MQLTWPTGLGKRIWRSLRLLRYEKNNQANNIVLRNWDNNLFQEFDQFLAERAAAGETPKKDS